MRTAVLDEKNMPVCSTEGGATKDTSDTSNLLAARVAAGQQMRYGPRPHSPIDMSLPHADRKVSKVSSFRIVAEMRTSTEGCRSKMSRSVAASDGITDTS